MRISLGPRSFQGDCGYGDGDGVVSLALKGVRFIYVARRWD